jgi:HAD superfamily hydrolase (TIGR01509 family)
VGRLQAVIFDMDGLMVDSEPTQLLTTNAALASTGVHITEEEWRGMIGRRGVEILEDLKARYGFEAEVADLLRVKTVAYREAINREVVPMPGLFQAIERCKQAQLQIAVASSSVLEDIRIVVRNLGLDGVFDALVSGEHVKHGKPAPDIFVEAARVLGVEVSRCVALEDTAHGVIAAREAWMLCVAVPNDFTAGQDFSRASAVLGSLAEFDPAHIEALMKL